MSEDKKKLTSNFGTPVDNDQNSMTAGNPGPVKFPDFMSYTNLHLKGKEKGDE